MSQFSRTDLTRSSENSLFLYCFRAQYHVLIKSFSQWWVFFIVESGNNNDTVTHLVLTKYLFWPAVTNITNYHYYTANSLCSKPLCQNLGFYCSFLFLSFFLLLLFSILCILCGFCLHQSAPPTYTSSMYLLSQLSPLASSVSHYGSTLCLVLLAVPHVCFFCLLPSSPHVCIFGSQK